MTLPVKLTLATISASSFWLIDMLIKRFDWNETIFGSFAWPTHLIAVIFGVLVMAPYTAASRHRLPRALAMCVASPFIYFYAVKFVIDGPYSYDTLPPLLISGAGAALLVGLAVVVFAPRAWSWRLPVVSLMAGAIGGAAFEDSLWPWPGIQDLGGHYVWQLLVCLALHLSLRPART